MIKADFEVHTSDDGSFTINVDGKTWLHSADTYFRVGMNTYSTGNKTLPMMGKPTSSAGIDGIGPYNMVNYSYEANVRRVDALVKTYKNGNVAVFSQVNSSSLVTGTQLKVALYTTVLYTILRCISL